MHTELPISLLERAFWKFTYRFFNHRTKIARAIRTRRVKRPMPYESLQKAIWHALATFEHFTPNINALFLGSSHMVYGIAPKNFKTLQALNAGFNSGDAKLAYYTYQTIRKQWPQAPHQAVVISDDFWIGSHQIEFTPEFYQTVVVKQFTQMPYDSNFLMKAHDQFVAQHVDQMRAKGIPENTLNERGFIPGISANADANTTAKITSRVLGHIKFAFFEPTQLHYLVALKEAIKADGRQLIFLRFPVREDYLEILDANSKNVWAPTDSIREGSPLIDCFRMTLPPEDWSDADHFSEDGARRFTKSIEAQLLRLLGLSEKQPTL